MWYNRCSCGYRIAAIMYPSQGWDQGPTPCTRTRKRRKSRRLFICFLIWLKGGGPVGSDRTSERAKIGNLFTIFWATRNGRLLRSKSLVPVPALDKTKPQWGFILYNPASNESRNNCLKASFVISLPLFISASIWRWNLIASRVWFEYKFGFSVNSTSAGVFLSLA